MLYHLFCFASNEHGFGQTQPCWVDPPVVCMFSHFSDSLEVRVCTATCSPYTKYSDRPENWWGIKLISIKIICVHTVKTVKLTFSVRMKIEYLNLLQINRIHIFLTASFSNKLKDFVKCKYQTVYLVQKLQRHITYIYICASRSIGNHSCCHADDKTHNGVH